MKATTSNMNKILFLTLGYYWSKRKKKKSSNISMFFITLVSLKEVTFRGYLGLIRDDRSPNTVFWMLFRSLIQFNFLAEFLPLLNSLQRLRSKGPH